MPSLVIVGQGALAGEDGAAVLGEVDGVLRGDRLEAPGAAHRGEPGRGDGPRLRRPRAGSAAALDGAEVIFNLGADEIDVPAGPFVIYQGSHGDRGAHRADVILPGAAWTEETGHLRQHRGPAADGEPRRLPAGRGAGELGDPAGAVGGSSGATLPFDTLAELRAAMVAAVPHLGRIDVVPENAWTPLRARRYVRRRASRRRCATHYLANPIMRASEVMAELTRLAAERAAAPMAAE